MSGYASYEGARIVTGKVTMPMYGLWSADLSFPDSTGLPSTGLLTIGDLSLVGYVHRTGSYAGQRSARLAAGYGGWRKRVGAQSYHLPTGVPLALVLADVSAIIGERVDFADVGVIGGYYFREADVAQQVLRRLAGPVWYIDTDGTTRIRERPSAAITSPFLVTAYDAAQGRLSVATEHLGDWMPGNTITAPQFDGTRVIQSSSFTVGNDGTLRVECLVRDASVGVDEVQDQPTPDDRLMAAIRQIIRSELPSGISNRDSALVLDGGTGTDEHVATVEGVVNMFVNFIYFLNGAGDPSTWSGPSKLLDASTFPAELTTLAAAWLASCINPTAPTAGAGGGDLLPFLPPLIEAAALAKRASVASPALGTAEVFSG